MQGRHIAVGGLALSMASCTLPDVGQTAIKPASAPARPLSDELPAPIAQLQSELAGIRRQEVYPAIVQRFGPPARDVGSGLQIPQWDVAGGVLTMSLADESPAVPPTFRTADGKTFWLIQSHNQVGPNVIAPFELTTTPATSNHGTMFWVGNLQLKADGTFQFIDSDSNLRDRHEFAGSFLTKYPIGWCSIEYLPGITASTELESLSGDTLIATVRLASPSGKDRIQAGIRSDAQGHLLYLTPDGSNKLPFVAEKVWDHSWE